MQESQYSKTERFWSGDFGNEYVDRNRKSEIYENKQVLYAKLIDIMGDIKSVIELGPNIGLNLKALKAAKADLELKAVEINAKAVEELKKFDDIEVFHQSIFEYEPASTQDLSLCAGVLIHIPPEQLAGVYDKLYRLSHRYICVVEYYNPTPIELKYRGEDGLLFKRDFAGDLLDTYPDLSLRDYGFVYHRDPKAPLDDVTWFLLEKKG